MFSDREFKFLRTFLVWAGVEDRCIAAALELFASIALMLWYVLRFFLSRE